MAFSFLDIVMEAKGKKPIKITPDENYEKTDYTDGVEEEDNDEQTEDEPDDQEATPEDDNLEPEEDELQDDPEEGEDGEPTDYTETEEEIGDDGSATDGDGGTEEDQPSDYTSDGEEGSDDGITDDLDEPGDYTDIGDGDDLDAGDESPPEEGTEEAEGPTSDDRKNKALLEDLIKLKEIVGNFIDKTSTINGNDINQVKFTNQVNNNLNMLSKQIHNYIVFRFSRESYVRNLYFYNYSIEALNISINMVKKINGFKHNK